MSDEAKELYAFAKSLEPFLTGWTADLNNNDYVVMRKGAMSFGLAYADWTHKRLSVRAWNWPQYTVQDTSSYNRNTYVRNVSIDPQSLNPRESIDPIYMALSRGVEAIAKDISRRFLPEYERLYDRCEKLAKERQAYYDNASQDWQAICLLAQSDKSRNAVWFDTVKLSGIHGERRDGQVHLTLDLSTQQFALFVQAFGGIKPKD